MALTPSYYDKSARAVATMTDAALIADIATRMAALGWDVIADADTFGIACIAPAAALAGDLAIIFAMKDASVGTPTMLTPDTATTGVLMVGLYKGGALDGTETLNWDAADPLGAGGTFSGYWRGVTPAGSTRLTIWACEEALVLCLDNDASGTLKSIIAGAWVDPLSVETADCETTGRVYAMSVSGGVATTGMSANPWSTGTSNSATGNGIFAHGTSAGNAHTGSWVPRSSSWRVFTKHHGLTISANQYISSGGAVYIWPWMLMINSGTDCVGFTRQMGTTKHTRHDRTEQQDFGSGAEDAVHYMANGFTSDGEGIGLLAHVLL